MNKLFPIFVSLLLILLAPFANAVDKPNILLLLSDDHSYPYLSCYGSPNVRTPVIDQLAKEGMKCHRFFTAAPQCVPSRAALMTGRSAVAARMTRFSSPLPKDEVTLPELLRSEAGYYTGICGRGFHLDGSTSGRNPASDAILNQHEMKTFASRVDFLNQCGDNQVVDELAKFLDGKPSGKPFFMWANFSDPHHAWNPAKEFRPKPSDLVLPPHFPDYPEMREQLADYFGEINRLDSTIGGIIDLLKKRNLFDSTFILFIGDNGCALPHGKGSLYDPGSNVPCVARWPGHIPAGGESHSLLSGEDVAPTMLAAAGVKPGSKMSGVSFLSTLKGEKAEGRKFVFVERGPHGSAPVEVGIMNSSYDLSRAVRSDRYKFIYNCTPWIPYAPVDSAGGPGWQAVKRAAADGSLDPNLIPTYFTTPRPVYEFYDLDKDPSELNNLSGKPEVAEIEMEHRRALTEKMILDFDYLPLPAIDAPGPASKSKSKKAKKKK